MSALDSFTVVCDRALRLSGHLDDALGKIASALSALTTDRIFIQETFKDDTPFREFADGSCANEGRDDEIGLTVFSYF